MGATIAALGMPTGWAEVLKATVRAADVLRVEERGYVRHPLILDSEEGLLAQASKSLLVVGHQPLYADDVDELVRLAHELRGKVGALILPALHAWEWWPEVHKRVVEPLGLAPCSVLPVGSRLADSDAQALHGDGVRWALPGPFTPLDLRFAVGMVLSEGDSEELRIETRVPCSIDVEVESERRRLPARITDLSTTGAFVALTHPHQKGTSIAMRGTLAGRPISLTALVAWRTDTRTPSWRDRGMGVVFERVELAAFDLLRQEMDRALDRFRICARASAARPRQTGD